MKVKELISKLNYSSTLPIRMKEDIYDPGTILAWKYQDCEWKEAQGMPTRGGDYGKDI